MLSLPYAVALAAISALLGGAAAWGALSATVRALKEDVVKLSADVKSLSESVAKLTTSVEVLRALDSHRDRTHTGPHPIHTPPAS